MSYPKNTAICLQHLFPNANPLSDWIVSVHGDGKIEITNWNNSIGEKPTETEIENASMEAEKTLKFKNIRKKRNRFLAETDWMSGSDVAMSDKWKKYRQDLRDLPSSNSDPSKIVFPTKP